MKKLLIAALSLFVLAACSSTVDRSLIDQRELLTEARLTVVRMTNDAGFPELPGQIKKARAVLIIPGSYKAGFIVGAEYGNAVLVAKTGAVNSAAARAPDQVIIPEAVPQTTPIQSEELKPQSNLRILSGTYGLVNYGSGQWGNPVFYTMKSASIGLQIGGQSQETILTIMTQKGLNALLNRSVTLGGDVSVAFGPVGKGVEASTALDKQADIYAYSRAAGLYGGGSFEGSAISEKASWNMALYGNQAVPKQILQMKSSNLEEIEALRRSLP